MSGGWGAFAQAAAGAMMAVRRGQRQAEQDLMARFALERQQQREDEQARGTRELRTAQMAQMGVFRGAPRPDSPPAPILPASQAAWGDALAGATAARPSQDVDLGDGLVLRRDLDKTARTLDASLALEGVRQTGRRELATLREAGANGRAAAANQTRVETTRTREAGAYARALNRKSGGADAASRGPEGQRRAYVLRRVPQLMRPTKDPARPWAVTPGLSNAEAVAAAHAEYEAAAGAGVRGTASSASAGIGAPTGAGRRDTPAPPIAPISGPAPGARRAITADQAAFLRERKGMTDAQIRAQYEVH